jgi:FMN phosphatase YigB (HAD superfamily)
MDYIICDLDGTLADIRHREHHAQGQRKNWKKFFEGIPEDAVAEVVADILRHYVKTHHIVFVSGRPEHTRKNTEAWLGRHAPFVEKYELFMRPDGDFRPDNIVKAELYDRDIEPRHGAPFFVLDDRDKVVAMWRAKGLICLQVAEGNF